MKISQVLKDIRQQHQLTQEALAERLQVSRSAIARWESGKGIPDIGNLIANEEIGRASCRERV